MYVWVLRLCMYGLAQRWTRTHTHIHTHLNPYPRSYTSRYWMNRACIRQIARCSKWNWQPLRRWRMPGAASMYVCLCVWIYVCMYVWMYFCVYSRNCTYVFKTVRMHVCMYVRLEASKTPRNLPTPFPNGSKA